MSDRKLPCAQRIRQELAKRDSLYADLWRRLDSPDAADDGMDAIYPELEPLGVDVRPVVSIQLSWGGPADWLDTAYPRHLSDQDRLNDHVWLCDTEGYAQVATLAGPGDKLAKASLAIVHRGPGRGWCVVGPSTHRYSRPHWLAGRRSSRQSDLVPTGQLHGQQTVAAPLEAPQSQRTQIASSHAFRSGRKIIPASREVELENNSGHDIRRVTYHFADWFDHAEREVTKRGTPALWRAGEHYVEVCRWNLADLTEGAA